MARGLRADQERPGRRWEGFGRGCRPDSVRDGVQGVRGVGLTAYQAHVDRPLVESGSTGRGWETGGRTQAKNSISCCGGGRAGAITGGSAGRPTPVR